MLEMVMTAKSRSKVERPYPPDFASAATLAYRLDCSESTVPDYVRRGILPEPNVIGGLVRWYWPEVERNLLQSQLTENPDEFSQALRRSK
jgi:predicted DNA-binding transcriptional regulator AlpA